MQMISIGYILECMNQDKNYPGDMWEKCLNNKKRFNRSKFKEILQKMETLGHIERHGYKNDTYYTRYHHGSIEENVGFVNDMIFTHESKINRALKGLQNRRVFSEISKDLNSHKLDRSAKKDYESLLRNVMSMFEAASSILWTRENSSDARLRKELDNCFEQIGEFMRDANKRLLEGRKTNERIILQKNFNNKIPKAGYLGI